MRSVIVLIATVCFGAVAPAAPIPKELRYSDQQLMLGAWELVESTYSNQPYPSAVGTIWTFEPNKAHRLRPDKSEGTAQWIIDSKQTPKHFDWNTEEGSQFQGVYELNQDRLTISLSNPGNDRPTTVRPETSGYHFVFVRRK